MGRKGFNWRQKAPRGSHGRSPEGHALAGQNHRLAPHWDHHFPGDAQLHRLARALSARAAIDIKEFCEAVEFFARTRRALRSPTIADLFCGHGLAGLLFALFERTVEHVILIDRRRPAAHDAILAAVLEIGPWVAPKITYRTETIRRPVPLPEGTAILGIHACGPRTDRCLKTAIACQGPVAVMPCCHHTSSHHTRPTAFQDTLGTELAIDIDRTYRLEGAGYRVDWTAIPRAITPKNRVIIATPGAPPPRPQLRPENLNRLAPTPHPLPGAAREVAR